ncbi:MAG: divergent PAP2 family protein [Candidatus Omnitrophica bacterium]|nr:divergent PAP2 family protein [Candidatus Omnitrophota bacterium]MDD5311144.1 divergent PAP2 family protein [Candidatus Omnitrophota bacterium]MDD5546903.1 divergent PAP2 family protein [Candidatus Omnitrophota bacterium]
MNNSVFLVFQNKVFLATLLGWVTAQTIKIVINSIREKKFNFRWVVSTGGMPSAHSSGVMALATAVGIQQGFDSALFVATLVFAVVIAFDAQGVRRATGQQAEILNKIMDDIYWRRKIQESRLKELIGHTPFEVFVGSLIGIVIAAIIML